uniref:Uncharacterized protein n=1 Tax=Arundo donax TaxID=35708 RepID=A0A0A9D8C5_ARUDO
MPAATYVPFVVQPVCQPEGIALVESEAGVDNHGDPEGGEEEDERNVPALAVVANDAASGVLFISGGGGGVATNDGAEGASQCHVLCEPPTATEVEV